MIHKLRSAITHRGLWMGLLLKEAKERGLEWEEIGHSAYSRPPAFMRKTVLEAAGLSHLLTAYV